jgi:hypothetical protein
LAVAVVAFYPSPQVGSPIATFFTDYGQAWSKLHGVSETKFEIPFDNILDRVTGSNPTVTDYILEEPAKLPELPVSRKDTRRTSLMSCQNNPFFHWCASLQRML